MKLLPSFKLIGWAFVIALSIPHSRAQSPNAKQAFSRQDSLRGSLPAARSGWDVLRYDLEVTPDFLTKTIQGSVQIRFKVVAPFTEMQIDLQEPLQILSVRWHQTPLSFIREGNVFYLRFPETLSVSNVEQLQITYSGKPREALRAPWEGGWIFSRDSQGRPWMSVACQGLGASVWYPCKDHQSDEPDSGASLRITVPDTLVAVANGRLQTVQPANPGFSTYTWAVVNPINNYNLIPYIGKYVSWEETFAGEKGPLDCTYWVLDYELERAREQFKQAPVMLKHFEYWFGPYPFYEDGYKLVQSPHLGMEHQSAVAYGNGFQNGYLGRDLSGTGWGKKWDFIIIHESGHEWFANNVTTADIADMWVHEGFTNYSETLFTTREYGIEAGNDYVIGTRRLIRNDQPIIGPYGVNKKGSDDMYYKGGNLLHTIRNLIDNDEKFRSVLRGINQQWYHKITSSRAVEKYISDSSGIDFSKVFDQYLRTTQIPELELRVEQNQVYYRWTHCIAGFNMPIKLRIDQTAFWIYPEENWRSKYVKSDLSNLQVDRNFYVTVKKS